MPLDCRTRADCRGWILGEEIQNEDSCCAEEHRQEPGLNDAVPEELEPASENPVMKGRMDKIAHNRAHHLGGRQLGYGNRKRLIVAHTFVTKISKTERESEQ